MPLNIAFPKAHENYPDTSHANTIHLKENLMSFMPWIPVIIAVLEIVKNEMKD